MLKMVAVGGRLTRVSGNFPLSPFSVGSKNLIFPNNSGVPLLSKQEPTSEGRD